MIAGNCDDDPEEEPTCQKIAPKFAVYVHEAYFIEGLAALPNRLLISNKWTGGSMIFAGRVYK